MRKNIYTETIDSIRVSETTLRKALEAVGKTDKGDITMTKNKKLKFTGMVAASLAVVIAGGTAAGYLPGSGKADVTEKTAASSSGKTSSTNSFTLMVNAAELTEEPMIISSSGNPAVNSAEIKANKIRGISLSEGDDEGGYSVSYNVPLEISCEGENISSVTYSVDTGAVSVAYYMGEDPVKAGTETNRCDNTMEGTVPLKPEYQKMRDELIKEIPSDGDGDAEVEWSDEELEIWEQIDKSCENSTFKHYSSITIAPDDPNLDYSSFALVGSSKELSMDKRNYLEAHKEDLFSSNDEQRINEQKKCIDMLINGQVIHCTVTFNDGTQQTQDIQVGTEIAKYGDVLRQNNEPENEKIEEFYDYKDVYMTYSLA